MRKEAVVAIVFGLFLGLLFAFGIFQINNTIKTKNHTVTDNSLKIVTNTKPQNQNSDSTLTLLKPNNKQVFGDDNIQIVGMTKVESYIITTGGNTDQIIKTAEDGSFDFKYKIDPSLNLLEISSVSQNNERSNTKLAVVYSSEATQKQTAISEGSVEISTDNKLEQLQNRNEFFLGTVTDLVSGGLQIKNDNSEIKQVSFTENTTFAKIGKTTAKITASDIAIGDYIIAMGFKKENGVLDTFRILVTQPQSSQGIKFFYGTVTNKTKTDIEITEENSGNVTITIDNNSKTYKGDVANPAKIRFANILKGDIVIGTFVTEKDENIARRIHVLKTTDQPV